MSGTKGVYELVNFIKDSKSLQRFKTGATQFDSYTEGKSDAAIEHLVSPFPPVSNEINKIVLENVEK